MQLYFCILFTVASSRNGQNSSAPFKTNVNVYLRTVLVHPAAPLSPYVLNVQTASFQLSVKPPSKDEKTFLSGLSEEDLVKS